jgi:segregation and condensation protein B
LAKALDVPLYAVEEALEKLGARYQHSGAVQLIRIAGGYQLTTKPEYAEPVARFLRPQKQRLSRSLLETLAIVAYRQPITLPEIDAIRGVQSDYSIRQLVEKRLIRDVGRKDAPGRPLLYGTTQQFLHTFNLEDISHLPAVEPHLTTISLVDGAGHEEQPGLFSKPEPPPDLNKEEEPSVAKEPAALEHKPEDR